MISSQMITEALSKIKQETGVELVIYTPQDLKIEVNGTEHNEGYSEIVRSLEGTADPVFYKDRAYFRLKDDRRQGLLLECACDEKAILVGRMAKLQIENLVSMNEERFDMDNFFKNLLLDNLLIVDIYSRSNALHINPKTPRVAFLVELSGKADENAVNLVRSIIDDTENNFVTAVNENSIVLVKEMKEGEGEAEMLEIAQTLVDMLNSELMEKAYVACGNVAREIREVANSYKEARLALSVGKIFNPEKTEISYSSLGIGRLIYQLPLPMCKMFIHEIFKGNSPEQFDEETITTINEFFANNLNVSETSRKLYIHRNTLVYRLDKIQKMTGLDLRVFDDAITFQIALMVTRYMKYMENAGDGKRGI